MKRQKSKPRRRGQKRSFGTGANVLMDFMGGGKTSSGQRVNETSAMKVASFYNGVKVIAQSIASLPLITYRRLKPRGRERATDHFLYFLLHDEPNPEMTSFVFRMVLMVNALPWNNAYATIKRDPAGRAVSLWPIHPSRLVRVFWTPNKTDRVYIFRDDDNREVHYPSDDVLHIRGVSLDGWSGLPLFSIAGESLGLTLAAQQYGSRFFGNNAQPSVVLKHPGTLDEEAAARLRQSWNSSYRGEESRGTAVLEEGMSIETIAVSNNESQFLETRQYQVPEACRWLDVSPSKVHDHTHSTFSNIEHLDIEFAKHTIRPWCVNIEQELNRKLVPYSERGEIYIEFNIDGLLRGDYESRWRAYSVGRQNGILSANEIRELENMNPIDSEAGDAYLVNGNMISIETALTNQVGNSASSGSSGDRAVTLDTLWDAYKPLFSEVGERMARREVNAAGRVPGDALPSWAAKFYANHAKTVRASLVKVCDSYFIQKKMILGCSENEDGRVDVPGRVADAYCTESRANVVEQVTDDWHTRAGDVMCECARKVLYGVVEA